MSAIVVAAVPSFNPIPNSGILNQIFHQTDMTVQVLDWPAKGYHINLAQLIILIALAVVVLFVTEKLTKQKPGGVLAGVILTVIGAYIFETFAQQNKLPFDFAIEGVLIISSLIGAIIVSVFYTLIRGMFGGSKK